MLTIGFLGADYQARGGRTCTATAHHPRSVLCMESLCMTVDCQSQRQCAPSCNQGFQKNPGARTLEDAIERALHAAGGVMPSNFGDLRRWRCCNYALSFAAIHRDSL